VLQSSKHLLNLLNDILDLSKVENGKMEFNPSQIDLKKLIKNSMNMFKEKAKEHNIVLSSDIDKAPETIKADERKLQQIIYNLVSNAVKFTKDNGKVSLTARKVVCKIRTRLRQTDAQSLQNSEELAKDNSEPKNNRVSCLDISVTDTGIGLEPEHLKRVFNRFEQIDGSVSRKHMGTGLGLSLTSALVKLHGGKIWAESKGKDKGSTFRFIIPV
jgi:signal transduction histidine kinase